MFELTYFINDQTNVKHEFCILLFMIHIYCRTINKKYKIAIQHYGYGKKQKNSRIFI